MDRHRPTGWREKWKRFWAAAFELEGAPASAPWACMRSLRSEPRERRCLELLRAAGCVILDASFHSPWFVCFSIQPGTGCSILVLPPDASGHPAIAAVADVQKPLLPGFGLLCKKQRMCLIGRAGRRFKGTVRQNFVEVGVIETDNMTAVR